MWKRNLDINTKDVNKIKSAEMKFLRSVKVVEYYIKQMNKLGKNQELNN